MFELFLMLVNILMFSQPISSCLLNQRVFSRKSDQWIGAWWFWFFLTQPKSKNRSNKFSETLIKVITLTCSGGRLKIYLSLKSQAKEVFLVQQSHLTDCQDLDKASPSVCNNLFNVGSGDNSLLPICQKISNESCCQACYYFWRSASIIERQTKLYFMKCGNQLTKAQSIAF